MNRLLKNLIFAAVALVIIVNLYPSQQENHFYFEENKPWNYAKLIAPCDIPIRQDTATVNARMDSLNAYFMPVFKRVPGTGQAVRSAVTHHVMEQQPGMSDNEKRLLRRAAAYIDDVYRQDVVANNFGSRIDSGLLPEVRILVPNASHHNAVTKMSTAYFNYPNQIVEGMIAAMNDTGARFFVTRYGIAEMLSPSLVCVDSLTNFYYQLEEAHIKGDKGVIQQGEAIIDKGQVLSHQDYINILTYEEFANKIGSEGKSGWLIFLGRLLYVATLLGALLAFFRFSHADVWARPRSMAFIFLVVTVFFMCSVGAHTLLHGGIYIVPYGIVPILLVVFFNTQVAVFVTLILTLLCSPCASFSLEFISLQFCASLAAVYSLQDLSRRSQLLRTSLFVMGSYCLTYLAVEMMTNGSFETFSIRMVGFLCISAILSSVAYILMAAVERYFGFVSKVTLIELGDVNNPLLRKLSEECPGTFQHSIAVGNLATDAAIKIGANEQLVRAGALYHDIGKISNPNFFTENQHGVNPHDALSPDQSARIIVQHVTDGLARADRAGLPAIIKDFIREHHGAGKAKYFYYTYCQAHPGEEVDPAPFTYPGPNPQSRETSLLMMADSVEAASRSLKEHTPEAIAALVNKIIDAQVAEGLHNDSSLSFRDVKIIKEEFIKRLMTMYHSRIRYPEDPAKKAAAAVTPTPVPEVQAPNTQRITNS